MTQEKQYYSIRYMLENITAKLNSIDNRLKTVESKYLYNPISEIRNLIKKKSRYSGNSFNNYRKTIKSCKG